MPAYSLDLEGPNERDWIENYEFSKPMQRGDRFRLNGWTWEVVEVATSQEREEPVLRCIAV
jgi:hypothetical protein